MSFPIEDDPILRVYNVKKTNNICYDVSGFFSPISIRDQIVRTCSIIDRAIRHELISSTRPLLVVGGGIVGVTAAIKAIENGIKTVLVEKKKPLQNLKHSVRFFSPVQYDWTVKHWTSSEFPWKISKSIPVNLPEGSTSDMLATIKSRYEKIKAENRDLFEVHNFTELVDFNIETSDESYPFLVGFFKKKGADFKLKCDRFGMGLSCTGFGKERTFLNEDHPYKSLEFWKLDKFDFVKKGNVLICGGGDGALQDFLLMATNKESAKAIYISLELTATQIDDVEKAIFEVEEKNARESIWWSKKDTDQRTSKIICELNRDSQKVHLEKVNQVLQINGMKKKLENIVRKDALKNINLAYPCDHFTGCYPLNRFLALLIGTYIKSVTNRTVFYPFSSIENVESAENSHKCNQDANDCLDYKHKVTFLSKPKCCYGNSIIKQSTLNNLFDYVMLRFGIMDEKVPQIFKEKPAIPGAQITPYTLS